FFSLFPYSSLFRSIPLRLLERAGQAYFVPASQIGRHFAEQVGPKVPIVILERSISVIRFRREQGTDLVLRRGEHEQIPLSIKLTASHLHNPFFNHLSRSEIHRSRSAKVAIFSK